MLQMLSFHCTRNGQAGFHFRYFNVAQLTLNMRDPLGQSCVHTGVITLGHLRT